jgi:hypothetical protein
MMPGVAMPEVREAPTPPVGHGILSEIGDDLAEAGRTAGAGLLTGIAIVGGLVATELTPSGQIAR